MYFYQFINLQCTAKVFASVMQQMGNTSVANKPINIQHQRPSHQSFWNTSKWNSPDITIVAWLPIYSKLLTHELYGEENEANFDQSCQFICIFTMKQVLKLSKVLLLKFMTLILLNCMSLILLYQLPAVNYFTISASLLVHSQQIVTDNKFLNCYRQSILWQFSQIVSGCCALSTRSS